MCRPPHQEEERDMRDVCDYALTNLQVQQDSYPLPLTEEIVTEQAACELFSITTSATRSTKSR